MTKKARRRWQALLNPRPPRKLRETYGLHILDSTREEIMPRTKPAPVDEPQQPADHLLRKSDLVQNLQVLFDAALARAGAFNSDDDLPDYSTLAEEANLTLAEYEAVAMSVDGHSREEIAKWQHVSVDAVDAARRRGLEKLLKFILN